MSALLQNLQYSICIEQFNRIIACFLVNYFAFWLEFSCNIEIILGNIFVDIYCDIVWAYFCPIFKSAILVALGAEIFEVRSVCNE